MISLSPFIPCIDEDKTFFTEVLFVTLLKNSLEPCLIGSRMGILEHVRVVLPSRGIVPGRHDTSEAHVSRGCELKVFQSNFPIIMHDAFKVRVENGRRVYRRDDSMGREFY